MSTAAVLESGVDILNRAILPQDGEMSVEAARVLLRFRLHPSDEARVNELAAKAREGVLSDEERAQLDEYEIVSGLLELLQSKARLVLKQAGETR